MINRLYCSIAETAVFGAILVIYRLLNPRRILLIAAFMRR